MNASNETVNVRAKPEPYFNRFHPRSRSSQGVTLGFQINNRLCVRTHSRPEVARSVLDTGAPSGNQRCISTDEIRGKRGTGGGQVLALYVTDAGIALLAASNKRKVVPVTEEGSRALSKVALTVVEVLTPFAPGVGTVAVTVGPDPPPTFVVRTTSTQ
jgi:hypothetical protein